MLFDDLSLRALFLAALLGAASCSGPQTREDPEPTEPGFDDRKIRYELDRRDGRLHVTATFLGDESGETTFALPDRRGSQTNLHRGVREFRTRSESVEVSEGDEPHLRVLEHEPETVLNVRYEVVQTFESDYRANRFRPIIGPSGAYFIGKTVLGYPERMHIGLQRPIVLDWSGLDEESEVVHSFGRVEGGEAGPQSLETALGAVQNALFMMGEVDVHESSIRGSTVLYAGLGDLPVRPAALSEPVGAILRAQREFWGDLDLPPYLIGLYGLDDCCWSVGDTVYHGFASLLGQREPRTLRDHVLELVAHEHLHRWIPDRLGAPRPFRAYLWFVEGFTEYYARRFKLQTDTVDFEEFVDEVNETVQSYWTSEVRGADRTRVQEGFRSEPPLTRLPYQRGDLLALNWNARIAEATGGDRSLDDVMYELRDQHDADDGFRVSDDSLADAVREVAPEVEIADEIDAVLDRGERLEISEDALGPCATFEPATDETPPRFEVDEEAARSRDCLAWFR